MSLLKIVRSPLIWFIVLLTGYSAYKLVKDDKVMEVIRSDGRGYYAYLPALLIYNDPTFDEPKKAEQRYHANDIDQLYLFKDKNGHVYDKYFPGTALLQLPFPENIYRKNIFREPRCCNCRSFYWLASFRGS